MFELELRQLAQNRGVPKGKKRERSDVTLIFFFHIITIPILRACRLG